MGLSDAFMLLCDLNPTKNGEAINAADPEAESIVREFQMRTVLGLAQLFDAHNVWTREEILAQLRSQAAAIHPLASRIYSNRLRRKASGGYGSAHPDYVLPKPKDSDAY